MRKLLVGKTGVFDTLVVAAGYMNETDIYSYPFFADLKLENQKKLVKAGIDQNGEDVYIVGCRAPELIPVVQEQLQSLSNINEKDRLEVIPVSVKGENVNWLLTKLANLPLIGVWFFNWAKRRTLHQKNYLIEIGRNISRERNTELQSRAVLSPAAKPLEKREQN